MILLSNIKHKLKEQILFIFKYNLMYIRLLVHLKEQCSDY